VVVVPRGMVTIMGEVRRPGSYPTRGRLTVVELIAQAEGFNDAAAVNDIKVLHTDANGASSETLVGVYDIMNTAGKGNENVVLSSGDVVIVPKSVVMIMGEVAKPGYYPTRGRLTVLELIALAEGFTKFASRNEVKVVRTNADGTKTESVVRASDLMQKGAASGDMHLLQGGDVVIVP
jgi:polysaccharide export outer membrane protein